MAYQDYTTYSETDALGHLTITANNIAISGLDTTEDVCVWKDFGAGYYAGDFMHVFTFKPTTFTTNPYIYLWGVSNSDSAIPATAQTMSCQTLAVAWDQSANGFYVLEQDGLPPTISFDYLDLTLAAGTEYTYKVYRDENSGTYGTLTLELYALPTDSTPAYSVTLNLSAKRDYRYLYQLGTGYSLVSGTLTSGYIKNLSLEVDPNALTFIVSDVRRILNEPDEGFWTNTELKTWAYDAVVDIAIRTLCVQARASITTSAGTRTYAMTGHDSVYAAYNNIGMRKAIEKQDGHHDFPVTSPRLWWERKGYVGVEPKPDDAYVINLYTATSPAAWTGAYQTVPIRAEFCNLIILYVLIRAYLKDGQNETAAKLYDLYIQDVKDLTTIYTEEHILAKADYATPDLVMVQEQQQNAGQA